MFILVLAILGLLAILFPVILGAKVVDKSEVPSVSKAIMDTPIYERLEEAFSNQPFAIAMIMIAMTIAVLSVAGILVFGSYSWGQ